MQTSNFELINRPNGVRVRAKFDGKQQTIAFFDTEKQARDFVEKCKDYNDGVYSEEVFITLNSLRMP